MKRLPVILRPAAAEDLAELAQYIAEKSGHPRVALDYVRRMRRRCDAIGDAPDGGAPRPDLGNGLRLIPFEHPAVILYRVEDGEVAIINVFHGGRDDLSILRDWND